MLTGKIELVYEIKPSRGLCAFDIGESRMIDSQPEMATHKKLSKYLEGEYDS
jgi:hypothetical protein